MTGVRVISKFLAQHKIKQLKPYRLFRP